MTFPDKLPEAKVFDKSPRDETFSFADFELLHQWTLATANSLASNANLQRVMREAVPVLAMNHRFLMWVDQSRSHKSRVLTSLCLKARRFSHLSPTHRIPPTRPVRILLDRGSPS
jgi:hypothetical protein